MQKKRKKLLNKAIDIFLILMIIICAIYVFWKPIRNAYMTHKTNEYQIAQVTPEEIKENQEKEDEANYNFEEVVEYQTLSNFDVKSLPAVGGIAIPELDVNLLIFNGLDNKAISYGAGTMKPNQVMGEGNYSLASHHVFNLWNSSKLLFSPLERASQGMLIYTTDKTNVYTYEITEVFTVDPTATYVLDETDSPTITLVTCTDNYAQGRIIVKGKLVNVVDWEHRNIEQDKAFQLKYNY